MNMIHAYPPKHVSKEKARLFLDGLGKNM